MIFIWGLCTLFYTSPPFRLHPHCDIFWGELNFSFLISNPNPQRLGVAPIDGFLDTRAHVDGGTSDPVMYVQMGREDPHLFDNKEKFNILENLTNLLF